jgi:hypothetical protein
VIRLAALACGVLCGLGLALSGGFHPAMALRFLSSEMWDPAFGVVLLSALVVGALVLLLARALMAPQIPNPALGGEIERAAPAPGWRAVVGGALFGVGFGITGYLPLTALVALGVLAPGAALFLTAAVAGMVLHDLIADPGRLKRLSG